MEAVDDVFEEVTEVRHLSTRHPIDQHLTRCVLVSNSNCVARVCTCVWRVTSVGLLCVRICAERRVNMMNRIECLLNGAFS